MSQKIEDKADAAEAISGVLSMDAIGGCYDYTMALLADRAESIAWQLVTRLRWP